MKLITAKHRIQKEHFKASIHQEEIEKDVKERIFQNIGRGLQKLIDVKKENFKIYNFEEILFETGFYIAPIKEFDELVHLIHKNKYFIDPFDYLKFKNILENYEK